MSRATSGACDRTYADVLFINALADNPALICGVCNLTASLHDAETGTGEGRRYGPKPIMAVRGLTTP